MAGRPPSASLGRVLAFVWSKIGNVQAALGRHPEALESSPPWRCGSPWRRDLTPGLGWLGNALRKTGALAEARATYRRALAIAEAHLAADPRNVQARRDLAVSRLKLGEVPEALARRAPRARQAPRWKRARQWFRSSFEIFERLGRERRLARYDDEVAAEIRRAIANCDAALTRLAAPAARAARSRRGARRGRPSRLPGVVRVGPPRDVGRFRRSG